MFPRPGFPPGGPGFGLGMPGGPSFGGSGVPLNVTRQRKRLYVGNITYDCNEQNISQLFNEKMRDIGFSTNELGEPVVGVQVNHDKSYAFVEVRTLHHIRYGHPRRCTDRLRCAFACLCSVPKPRGGDLRDGV